MDGALATGVRPWRIIGGPGSPYSLKLRAVFRYRRIPHLWVVPRGWFNEASELAEAGKGMLPVLQAPEGGYQADSTPLILDLEARWEGRSVLPPDPARRFLAALVEDFADEWLTWCLFDYRWDLDEDVVFCARRQIAGWVGAMPGGAFDEAAGRFAARQRKMREKACGGAGNRPLYRETYRRTLDILERMEEERLFLFGDRPSNGDFGLYGSLSQLAIDPTPSAEMKARAPRSFQWVQTLDDASGLEGEWAEGWTEALEALLTLSAQTHLRLLTALAEAERTGADMVRFDGLGHAYALPINPARVFRSLDKGFGYRIRCLLWLKAQLAALPEAERARIEPMLRETGCWDLLQFREGEAARASEIRPQ